MAENTTQSPQKPAEKGKKLFTGKRNRKWIALCLLAVAAAAGGTVLLNRAKARTDNTETTYTTAAVEKRSITNSLTGSGTLAAGRFLHCYHAGFRRGPQRHL